MSASATLRAVKGPLAGRSFEFKGRVTFIVGRAPDCHAQLEADEQLSRHHFLLDVDPPRVRIRDLGSRNGTYVNGARLIGSGHAEGADSPLMPIVPQRFLAHGDRIRVGESELVIDIVDATRCLVCGHDARHGTRLADGQWLCAACASLSCDASTYGARPRCAQCAGTDGLAATGPGRLLCAGCRELCRADPLGRGPNAASPALPGEIGGYVPIRVLGKGGMGAVYLALRSIDGLEVALKVMLAEHSVSEASRARFLREVEVQRDLSHPGIVRLLAQGSAGAHFYFAMELVGGGTLADLMRRSGGRLTPAEAVPLLLASLDALAHAHACGIVHRDIKPENILLATPGADGPPCKIADFGLAKHFEQAGLADITTGGFLAGTHAYMAREQLTDFRGVGPSADQWSLAATFFHALAGEPPRAQRRGQDPLQAILEHVVVPLRERNPLIHAPLAHAIDRALLAEPDDRWPDARRFAAAVSAAT